MNNRTIIIKTEEVEIVTDVLCSKCGRSCRLKHRDSSDDKTYLHGLIDQVVSGGYYSPAFPDMTYYRFSLCEFCLLDLFQSFVVPVEKFEFDSLDTVPEKFRYDD